MEKKKQIDCFLPYSTVAMMQSLAAQLYESGVVKSIYTLSADVPLTPLVKSIKILGEYKEN